MDKYIVISAHTADECRLAVKQFREHNAGYFTHFNWGCADNDHTAYAIIEADDHDTAKLTVPPLFRNKTKVVKVINYDPMETEDRYHKSVEKTDEN